MERRFNPEQNKDIDSNPPGAIDELTLGIEQNDISVLITGLDRINNINEKDSNGLTPLIAAIKYDRLDVITALLDRKDLDFNATDADGKTPMWHAIKTNNLAVRVILQDRDKK